MKKRFVPFVLVLTFLLSLCTVTASAADMMPFASSTISDYAASVSAGSGAGEINISYNITATDIANRIGISKIEIYKIGGGREATIYGSTENGLLKSDTAKHKSTYTYDGTSGVTYYAVVTFTATIGSESDQRTIPTNAAKAP